MSLRGWALEPCDGATKGQHACVEVTERVNEERRGEERRGEER